MAFRNLFSIPILYLFLQSACSAVLESYLKEANTCENNCATIYDDIEPRKACQEGCRLFTIIGLAKNEENDNVTLALCTSACTEAFNETLSLHCKFGCEKEIAFKPTDKDVQTLHLLKPLLYIQSSYHVASDHEVERYIDTDMTMYLQEKTGKLVIYNNDPDPLTKQFAEFKAKLRNYQEEWREERLDWVDCISHQSGLPRWLLVVVLFGFILALLWLCCATAVTAPNQHVSRSQNKESGYVLIYEPSEDMDLPPKYDEAFNSKPLQEV